MNRRARPAALPTTATDSHRAATCRTLRGELLAGVVVIALTVFSGPAAAQEAPAGAAPPPAAADDPGPSAAPGTPEAGSIERTEVGPAGTPSSPAEAAEVQVTPPFESSDESEEELVPLALPARELPAEPGGSTEAGDTSLAQEAPGDRILYSGYLPGYRRHIGLGDSPYAPRVGVLPGGMTPGYGAPVPPSEWTFEFAGYMSASLQASIDRRPRPESGQSKTTLHVPPETIDTWRSFTSTNSIPGNWVSLRFRYGNPRVSANVSLETWNPSRPTTYYQLGSQYFLNNVYLSYTPEQLGGVRLRIDAGRYDSSYGALGRWGNGLYVNLLGSTVEGVGERIIAEYDLTDPYMLVLEHGLMGTRHGTVPDDVIPSSMNGWQRPLWPGAWIHHAHVGLVRKGEPRLELQGHYFRNWSREDRNEAERDNPGTPQIDESDVRDGHIRVLSGDFKVLSDHFGVFGIGVSHVRAQNAFPLKGLITYGEDGEQLTNKWFGVTSTGTGKLLVFAFNYQVSLGQVLSYPQAFGGDGPDIVLTTGLHWAKTWTPYEGYDGRTRHKYGIDGLYTFSKYMGAGLRLDRVVPNSREDEETFHVVAPRLQFKTGWNSHEALQLMYAKWFYGEESRNEGTGLRTPERLDDQMIALNFNMWW